MRIVVSGASGQLGQLVVDGLLEAGVKDIIATTRQPAKLAHLALRGVEVRPADFKGSPAEIATAFRGATHLLLISTTDLGARVEQHKNAILAARLAGVEHIVYTSWPNPEKSPAAVAAEHAATEKLIRESGLKYTFLRNSLYAENLLGSLPSAIEMGKLYGSSGAGKAAYVLRADCARAAVGALLHSEKFVNKTFDITGPKAYSHGDLARMASQVTGKKVDYVDLSPEEFKQTAIKSGLPELYASLFVSFDLAIKSGELSQPTNAVEVLSGKPAQDIAAFLGFKILKSEAS